MVRPPALGTVRIARRRRGTVATTGSHPALLDRPARFVLHYLARRPLHFSGVVGLVLGATACAVGVQYGMKLLVDALASPDRAMIGVWSAFWLFIGLVALESILWRLTGFIGSQTVIATGIDVRLDLFEHLSGHALRYFSDRLAGALGNRVTGTAGNLCSLINTFIWNITPPCVDFAGALIIFATFDGRMAFALALFVAVLAAGLGTYGIRGRAVHQDYAEHANKAGGELVDALSNIWSVKAFSARYRERARLAGTFVSEGVAQRRSWRYLETLRVIHDVCFWAMSGGMVAWALVLWRRGEITPGDVVVVSSLTFRILHGSRDLALALVGTSQNLGFIAETLRQICRPHEIADADGALALDGGRGRIELEGVWFSYPGGSPLFRDLNLTIEAGQSVGIVGPSGAGKSTLVQLVQRVHDVQHGHIRLDGQPIAVVTQDSLHAAIAVVPQEISLFHRSVLENIRYGRAEASEAEVVAAARLALCDDFIRRLPLGYQTVVGERGANLSGGQRQRIGIARAVLKDAPILILDEATSGLDTEAEIEVQHALAAAARNRTVLAVAHRLSTVAAFDRIIMLIDGEIVEDGSPCDLRRNGGLFDRVWRLQSAGLSVDDALDV